MPSLKRTVLESSSIFEESLQWRRLMNANTRLWITWQHWQRIRSGDTSELSIAADLNPALVNGWISVHIAAAAFDTTFMSMWLKANGIAYKTVVPFKPHKQAPIFHMPEDEFSWSKYRRNVQPDALPSFYRYVEEKLQGGPCLVVRNNDELTARIHNEVKITHNVHGINTYSDSTAAGAYWLMDATASYLMELGTDDWFVLVRLVVNDSKAALTLEDGNGAVRAQQEIPYTDFPLPEQIIYACWDGEHWVLMLPSEY